VTECGSRSLADAAAHPCTSAHVYGRAANPTKATRFRPGAQCSRGPPAPTPLTRQVEGICLLAPCAVKAACTVRGRGQGLNPTSVE
jgi:hypothetical protein